MLRTAGHSQSRIGFIVVLVIAGLTYTFQIEGIIWRRFVAIDYERNIFSDGIIVCSCHYWRLCDKKQEWIQNFCINFGVSVRLIFPSFNSEYLMSDRVFGHINNYFWIL